MNDRIEPYERKTYIDFLKVLGLLSIIFAHVNGPSMLETIRTFDVPLMVILSGILAKNSFSRSKNRGGYLLKRICRLVIPTWIFLCFFFFVEYFAGNTFDFRFYLDTFLLTRYGYGYVWIVLIYIYCAVTTALCNKIKVKPITVAVLVVIYLLYELAFYFNVGTENKIFETVFYYFIPYGLFTIFGLNYDSFSKKTKAVILSMSLLIFVILAVYMAVTESKLISPSSQKYPPRIYFNSYSLFVSILLLLLFENKNYSLFKSKIIQFVSSHSFWIYLWHILFLLVWGKILGGEKWYLNYILVVLSSVVMVYLQNKIIDLIERKHKVFFLKYFRG